MIFWFTGQPGHGKTLHGIDKAIEFRDQGRLVFVCNVTGFDYEKAGMLPMTPEQFRDWMNFLPDGAVALVDEAYEHGMLPKRPPGSKLPAHVEQLAKHRHRGLDFIFISQSPAKQVDEFVHDLIERHIHVRRRFGLPFVHLRVFDYYERNPVKAHPLIKKRVRLPKRPMGLYTSTVMDTTEKNVPWYYIAITVLFVGVCLGAWYMMNDVEDKLSGTDPAPAAQVATVQGAGGHGANATGPTAPPPEPTGRALREKDFNKWMEPRVAGQPWTAPAYDQLSVGSKPPRIFCAIRGIVGSREATCSCVSEQMTKISVDLDVCQRIVLDGQYEPFIDVTESSRRMDDFAQYGRLRDASEYMDAPAAPTPSVPRGEMAHYGDMFRQ